MKKRLILFVLIFTLAISSYVFAEEPVVVTTSVEQINDNVVTPDTTVQFFRSITRTYATYADIPTSIWYQEYLYGSWFGGYLYLVKAVKNANGTWTATFEGYIIGQI